MPSQSPSSSSALEWVLTRSEQHYLRRQFAKLTKQAGQLTNKERAGDHNDSNPSSSANDRLILKKNDSDVHEAFLLAEHGAPSEHARLNTRIVSRLFVSGYVAHAILAEALPTLFRTRSTIQAIRNLRSTTSLRIASSLAMFSLLYRFVHLALLRARRKMLLATSSFQGPDFPIGSYRSRVYTRLLALVRSLSLPSFVAAALAALPSSIILPRDGPPSWKRTAASTTSSSQPSFPRRALALLLLSRGLHNAYNHLLLRRSRTVTWLPDWMNNGGGGALLYAFANAQLFWTCLFEPTCAPERYRNLILSRSSHYLHPRPSQLPPGVAWPDTEELTKNIARLANPTHTSAAYPPFIAPVLSALSPATPLTTPYDSLNVVLDFSPAHPSHNSLMCATLHPTEPSCLHHYANSCVGEIRASLRIGAALAALVGVFTRIRRALSKGATGTLAGVPSSNGFENDLIVWLVRTITVAVFFGGSVSSAWGLTCLLQHYLPRSVIPRSRYFLNGLLSSVFVSLVPADRRTDLGLYMGRMSAQSAWDVLEKRRIAPRIRNGSSGLIALALGLLCALYEIRSPAMTNGLRRILLAIIGPTLSTMPTAILDENEQRMEDKKRT